MIGTILWLIVILIGCGIAGFWLFCMAMLFGAAAGAAKQNMPQQKR